MPLDTDSPFEDRMKDYVVVALAVLAALGSLFAVVGTVPSFTDPQAYAITRAAGAIGGLFFAALYVLLGFRPRRYAGIWELVLLHRLVLAAGNGMLVIGGTVGAVTSLIRDVIVFALLLGAYAYGKGWSAWHGD